jgi:hypothetical protein
MDLPPSSLDLAAQARRLLALSRRDKRAAQEALAGLSLEQQIALVCETRAGQRARLLELLPEPEAVVPLLPEAELVFTVKAVGLDDASWLLEHATSRQLATCFDLDAWRGLDPDRSQLVHWFAVLAEANEQTLVRAAQAIDAEMLSLYLREQIHVMLDPKDDDWEPPPGAQTLEGQFYFIARNEGDDIAALRKLVDALFREDYWLYFRMMQSVIWELESELEEYALRWRSGRIEDLGFPSWDESMRIYGFLRPEQRAVLAERAWEHRATAWDFPVWIPDLPTLAGGEPALFRAAGELDDTGRRTFFYAFVALANKVAVADRMPLGDVETLPEAIEKAAAIASAGLEHVASEAKVSHREVIERSTLEYLFRVGASLDPDTARPDWLARVQAGEHDEDENGEGS